jgi:glyoxylate reductase
VGLVERPRPGVEALVVAGEIVDGDVLDQLPDLRLVATCGVGYDHISVRECRRRGIRVTYTPGVVSDATADLTFALLLALRRRIVPADRFVRAGRWHAESTDALFGHDLSRSTLGIVGLGRIGSAVARRARAFDMRVLYNARSRRPAELERELGVGYRPLDELLGEVDTVTLHCPLTEGTVSLLDATRLALLRDGASIINTARGGIINEQALVHELETGRLQAGLDVFVDEPAVPSKLFELENVVLTPHVGTLTSETRSAMTDLVVQNLLAFTEHRPLLTPVPDD